MSNYKFKKIIISVTIILAVFMIPKICYAAGAFDSAPPGYQGPGKPAGGSETYDPSSNSSAAAGQNPNINQRPDALKPNGYIPKPTNKPNHKDTTHINNTGMNPLKNPGEFEPTDDGGSSTVFANKASVILGAIQAVGVAAAVITIIILGIKYMTGSVEQRAEYKRTMIPYIIGAFFLVGTIGLLKFISKLKLF